MQGVHRAMQIFSIASQRAEWLSARLAVIASNVANATTPGYRAREIAPFADVLQQQLAQAPHMAQPARLAQPEQSMQATQPTQAVQATQVARTHPAHFDAAGGTGQPAAARFEVREARAGITTHSGNSVELEKEMLAGAETVRAFQVNTALVRSWHRMFMLALRDN